MPLQLRIIRLSWESDDFRIYRCEVEGGSISSDDPPLSKRQTVTLKGPLESYAPTTVVDVLDGKWSRHPKFGLNLESSTVVDNFDESNSAIFSFLQGMENIGPVRAKEIVSLFGDAKSTLSALLETPEDAVKKIAASIRGITEDRGEVLRTELTTRANAARLLKFLVNLDLDSKVIGQVYRALKDIPEDGVALLKRDPYIPARKKYLSFVACDAVARALDGDYAGVRAGTAAYLCVAEAAQSTGSTWIRATDVDDYCVKQALRTEYQDVWAEVPKAIEYGYLVAEDDQVCTVDLDDAEAVIAGVLLSIEGDELEMLESGALEGLSAAQRDAVAAAAKSPVFVLTGGPGVGKTFTVKKIIEMIRHNDYSVRCVAPTGVAAKRITEATGAPASTIHRMLGELRTADSSPNKTCFIVDETSMVSTELLAKLLESIPFSQDNRIVFVGDVDQLPSIDPGACLRDILSAPTIPSVKLTQIFRQSSESAIPYFARSVNMGGNPQPENDILFIPAANDLAAAEVIVDLVSVQMGAKGIDVFKDVQVLSPQSKGACGTQNLCERLRDALNWQTDRVWIGGGYQAGVGDRVIHTQNNYQLNVFNGEQGILLAANYKGLALSTLDSLQVPIPAGDSVGNDNRLRKTAAIVDFGDRKIAYPKSSLGELMLSYAITVHRSQGAQFPYVVMPIVSAHAFMLTRNLLYTGVTRTSRRLILVGQEFMLSKASANIGKGDRRTGLWARLAESESDL